MATADENDVTYIFGQNLRSVRLKTHLTQQAIAESAGMTRDAVSKLELGRRAPRLDSLLALSRAVGVDPCLLLDGLRPSGVWSLAHVAERPKSAPDDSPGDS